MGLIVLTSQALSSALKETDKRKATEPLSDTLGRSSAKLGAHPTLCILSLIWKAQEDFPQVSSMT